MDVSQQTKTEHGSGARDEVSLSISSCECKRAFLYLIDKMKKVSKNVIEAGQKKTNDPRLIEEIVKDFLTNSNSPFAVAYRQRNAELNVKKKHDQHRKVYGHHQNTELCVDLKTILLKDDRAKVGKEYVGTLKRDVECEEYLYDDSHFTFVEQTPQTVKRNPQVFNGKYITVTKWADGTLHPHLKPVEIGEGYDVASYASAVANELLWALEGLIEK